MAHSLAPLQQGLTYAAALGAAIVLFRLVYEGLLGRYRALAVFLGCLIAEVGVNLLEIPTSEPLYLVIYISEDCLLWLVQLGIVLELFSLVARDYPGIARSGRKVLWGALAIAVLVAAVISAYDPGNGLTPFPKFQEYILYARLIALTLFVFLGLTLAFVFWFPVHLSRNVVVYVIGFSAYFASRALTRLIGTALGPERIDILSNISLSVVLCCLLLWIVLLTRRGEDVDVVVGPRWPPERIDALLRKLDSINSALIGTARK